MGKPLSEETKQKIRDAFARKRELKANIPKEEETIDNIIYVSESDKEKLIEMGKQIQDGTIKNIGYTIGFFMYSKIV